MLCPVLCIYPATKIKLCWLHPSQKSQQGLNLSDLGTYFKAAPQKKKKVDFCQKLWTLWAPAFGAERKIPFYFCPDHDSEEDLSLQSHSFFLRSHLNAAAVTCLAQDIPIFGVWLCLRRQFFIPHALCNVLCLFYFIFFSACKSQSWAFVTLFAIKITKIKP